MASAMHVDWLKPWIVVEDPRDATAWSRELKQECPIGHILFGRDATFLARRQDRDDFLISLGGGEVAMVHLTWRQETNPIWPAAEVFASLEQWRDEVMIPEHAEWED